MKIRSEGGGSTMARVPDSRCKSSTGWREEEVEDGEKRFRSVVEVQ